MQCNINVVKNFSYPRDFGMVSNIMKNGQHGDIICSESTLCNETCAITKVDGTMMLTYCCAGHTGFRGKVTVWNIPATVTDHIKDPYTFYKNSLPWRTEFQHYYVELGDAHSSFVSKFTPYGMKDLNYFIHHDKLIEVNRVTGDKREWKL